MELKHIYNGFKEDQRYLFIVNRGSYRTFVCGEWDRDRMGHGGYGFWDDNGEFIPEHQVMAAFELPAPEDALEKYDNSIK